jgi:protein phosphatase
MGTTITAALLVGNRLIIAHVGDTRAYFINRNEIRQITEDHSLVNKLLKMGQLTPEQAKNYPHKNLVYKTLGTKAQVDVDIYEELLDVGDAVLICCDGLWDYFPNEELHKILTETEDFNKVPEILINLAKERGGKDNITLVIFELVSIE